MGHEQASQTPNSASNGVDSFMPSFFNNAARIALLAGTVNQVSQPPFPFNGHLLQTSARLFACSCGTASAPDAIQSIIISLPPTTFSSLAPRLLRCWARWRDVTGGRFH